MGITFVGIHIHFTFKDDTHMAKTIGPLSICPARTETSTKTDGLLK